jgi:hypothetical protein
MDLPQIRQLGVSFYQPEEVLADYNVDADELAEFIRAVTTTVVPQVITNGEPEILEVVAILAEGKSKLWLMSSHDDEVDEALLERLILIPAPRFDGPIALSIGFAIAGADAPEALEPPVPNEWREAIADLPEDSSLQIPEDIIGFLFD